MTGTPRPEDLLRPEVLAARAYRVPDASGLVKLDAMENPYPLPESLRREWAEFLAAEVVNRYPDADARELKAELRARYGIAPGYGILLGNGSDEIIQILALALARPGARALAFEPSFVMYAHCARLCGMAYTGVALAEDFSLPAEAALERIDATRPALVFIAQPNNPTGNLFEPALLPRIAEATPGLVVIDEAYHAFSGVDSLPLLASHPNVLVMRTLSKLGLAGLRIGFLAGAPEWIAQLEKVRMPYNVGVLAQAAGVFLLRHYPALEAQAACIRNDRERLFAALARAPDIEVWPSAANFLLFRVRGRRAADVHARLRDAGVLIKSMDGMHTLLRGCLRVTVGTPAENEAFLAALEQARAC
jgi:histidinol-phosphate aminotransferase